MRLEEVHLGIERLVILQIGPAVALKGPAVDGEVPIRLSLSANTERLGKLANVGCEIAALASRRLITSTSGGSRNPSVRCERWL